MNCAPSPIWAESNQQSLLIALGNVRRALEARIALAQPTAGSPKVDWVPLTSEPDVAEPLHVPPETESSRPPSALDAVCGAFGLSPFERDLLVLCAGTELDSAFATLVSQAQGDLQHGGPTFGLALASLPDAHWSALLPTAPLRRWRLIEMGPGDSLTNSSLRIDEWLLHLLAGTPYLDERLQPLVHQVMASDKITPSQYAVVERLLERGEAHPSGQPLPIIQFCGDSSHDLIAVTAETCRAMGRHLYRLSAQDVPLSSIERETFARLWEREAALAGSALLVDCCDEESIAGKSGETLRVVNALIESINGPVFVLTREPLRGLIRTSWKLDVPRPAPSEQRELWIEALGAGTPGLNGQLDAVVGQFCLTAQEVRETALALGRSTGATAQHFPSGTLWSHCRAHSRARLASLAQRLEPAATWDDLLLPEAQLRTLREIATHVRHRFRVHEQWGFAGMGARGLGISALFAGASGTGKTMAAEVLANELQLDLFRIDLSAVVSKYIGETEKNLRRVFDAAEAGGAILLFDEADALFGKRSEVKDSHDRYANIEVGYLLQRIESYRGLAVLTTNFKQALDTAFLRRLRFVVQFPFPDAEQRTEIWRRVFPAATPTDSLAPALLARLNVAGGNIRNIALHAAFLAADTDEPVRMKHLLHAARGECAKLERPPSEAELGGWV